MGIKDFFKIKEKVVNNEIYDPQIVTNKVSLSNPKKTNSPNFKGEVEQDEIKFPAKLGEEHPFDFAITEGLYEKFGFATGVVDKYVDFIVGPGFFVESDDERAKQIIDDFMQDVNFDTVLRAWIKEALTKNGFLELGGKKDDVVKGVKVLDSKYMYVQRNNKGIVEGFNQYKGGLKTFSDKKIIPFKPYQIAHLSFNKIGDKAYGLGIIYPAINTINNLLQNEKDLHMLMNRKANAPYHVKLGGVFGGKYYKPNPTTVASFGKDLQWLNNKQEWVTDGLTEIKVIDFGNIGEKFNEVLKYDEEMLLYTFQVPSVLMGTANINEGIAKVQMDAFERRVQSFQAEIEKVIEQKIFRRILNANGLNVHVEFQWGRPSNTERYERIDRMTNLLKIPTLSPALGSLLEGDIVKSFQLNEKEFQTMSVEQEKKNELDRPQPLVPGQNANPPQPAPSKPKEHIHEGYDKICPHCIEIAENFDKYNKIEEWLGFSYKDYVTSIETFISKDDFKLLKASTTVEAMAGKLNEPQVKEFKEILKKGFKKGKSIKEMVNEVNKKVKPKNLLKVENNKIIQKDGIDIIVRHKDVRALTMVRTEVTRVANAGAVEEYKKNGISKVQWVASFGVRTCPICEGYDGDVFGIDNHPAIPNHAMCRCSLIPVTELS